MSDSPVDDVADIVDFHLHDIVEILIDAVVDGAEQAHDVRWGIMLPADQNGRKEHIGKTNRFIYTARRGHKQSGGDRVTLHQVFPAGLRHLPRLLYRCSTNTHSW